MNVNQTLVDEPFIASTLGPAILAAAKANDPRAVLLLLLEKHLDLLTETDAGALFAAGLAVLIRRESFRDLLASRYGIYLAGRLPS
jgi:hypothetical protein